MSYIPNNQYTNAPELQYFGSNSSYSDVSGTMSSGVSSTSYNDSDVNNYDSEPPLLEELGIDIKLIVQRTLAVSIPFKQVPTLANNSDSDLAGPLVICMLLGMCMLLVGKIHFGYIYGFGLLGTTAMYIIINLMSHESNAQWPLSFDRTMSILGYSLVPIVVLSLVAIFIDLRGYAGLCSGIVCIIWATSTATRMFEHAIEVREQRYLIAYPATMLYACFTLLTIF